MQNKRVVWHVAIETLKYLNIWEFFVFNIQPCKWKKIPSGATQRLVTI